MKLTHIFKSNHAEQFYGPFNFCLGHRSFTVVKLPAHVGVRSPRSSAQSRTRPLCSILLPAHIQFHPAPVK